MASEIVRELVAGEWVTKVGTGGGGAPSGAAGGDLGGTYPNPEVAIVDDDILGSGTPNATTFLRGDRSWQVPAGGSQAAGDTGQIQFNSADAFAASPNLTADVTGGNAVLGLAAGVAGTALITAIGSGAEIQLFGQDGGAARAGGAVSIVAGASEGNDGGAIAITAGTDDDGGVGGNITIEAGSSPAGDGGELQLKGGTGDGGGRVLIQGGSPDGYVRIDGGAGGVLDVSVDGIGIDAFGSGKIGFFAATPVVKPTGVAVTAEAIHAALVTLGLIAGP